MNNIMKIVNIHHRCLRIRLSNMGLILALKYIKKKTADLGGPLD